MALHGIIDIVWMFITIPTYILILFITGFILNSKYYLQKLYKLNNKENKLTNNLNQLFKIILFSTFIIKLLKQYENLIY